MMSRIARLAVPARLGPGARAGALLDTDDASFELHWLCCLTIVPSIQQHARGAMVSR